MESCIYSVDFEVRPEDFFLGAASKSNFREVTDMRC